MRRRPAGQIVRCATLTVTWRSTAASTPTVQPSARTRRAFACRPRAGAARPPARHSDERHGVVLGRFRGRRPLLARTPRGRISPGQMPSARHDGVARELRRMSLGFHRQRAERRSKFRPVDLVPADAGGNDSGGWLVADPAHTPVAPPRRNRRLRSASDAEGREGLLRVGGSTPQRPVSPGSIEDTNTVSPGREDARPRSRPGRADDEDVAVASVRRAIRQLLRRGGDRGPKSRPRRATSDALRRRDLTDGERDAPTRAQTAIHVRSPPAPAPVGPSSFVAPRLVGGNERRDRDTPAAIAAVPQPADEAIRTDAAS